MPSLSCSTFQAGPPAPLPVNEQDRLDALHRYAILDTEPEQAYDDLALLAAHVCEAPISLISLVDDNRQWFKSTIGFAARETARGVAFCAHTIMQTDVLVVEDAQADERFSANPLVTGKTKVRFYAGAPLITFDGHALGSLCVIDNVPRRLSAAQKAALQALSRQVVSQLESHRCLTKFRENVFQLERAKAELEAKTAFLEAQVNSSLDGILVVGPEGTTILRNRRFAELFDIPDHILASNEDAQLLHWVTKTVKYPERFNAKVSHLYTNSTDIDRDEVELLDGSVLDRSSSPVAGPFGKYYGRLWTFRDITERKRAEEELRNLQLQLQDASRRSGMAEVATNVLHNVGNVLNSVNISAEMIAKSVRKSHAPKLAGVVTLLRDNSANLGEFLACDSRGKHVLAYLAQLSESLIADQGVITGEVNALQQNIEHVREIVAMQQNYAQLGGAKGSFDAIKLVEDSLCLNEGAFSRHHVEVVREFDAVGSIYVEKHKVLQILVNLLRNAKDACQESDRLDKRVSVRIARAGSRIKIAVADNGLGIAPGDLTRIFAHGFTTRKNGHGFGLHSAACAAREMGGSLIVNSAGHGLGATFTLELPATGGEGADE